MSEIIHILLSGGASAALIGFFVYVFRDTIQAALKRSVQRDIVELKAKLQCELEEQKERLKHDLAKDAMKAELVTAKTHETYIGLFELLRKAEGAVVGLTGVREVPDWQTMADEEIKQFFLKRNLRDNEIDKAIAAIDRGRHHRGFKPIQDLYQEIHLLAAERATIEAKNFAILNELYLSGSVRALAFELFNLLNGVRVDLSLSDGDPRLFGQAREGTKKIEPAMTSLMAAMRADLRVT